MCFSVAFLHIALCKWSSWIFDRLPPLVMYKWVVFLSVLNAWGIKLTNPSGLCYLGQLAGEEMCIVYVLFSIMSADKITLSISKQKTSFCQAELSRSTLIKAYAYLLHPG